MEKLYAGSIVCTIMITLPNYAYRTDTRFTAITFFANSKQEAIGIALEYAQKVYPVTEGYSNHNAVVLEVTEAQIYRAHELLESENAD